MVGRRVTSVHSMTLAGLAAVALAAGKAMQTLAQ
jgi:hypothetical protein